jgi:arylsulfatase A-like enzyme
MMKSARTGIAVALFLTSLTSAGMLLLNPRFVDDLSMGVFLLLAGPVAAGFLLALALFRPLARLADAGSSEDPVRAYELLWASLTGAVVFVASLAFLPPYLGIFSDSETVRYGGAMVLAAGLAALGVVTIRDVAQRFRIALWPLLFALPVTAVVLGGTEWGRGRGPASRILVIAVPGLAWNVAEDLVERGRMPNLAALRRAGSWGDVQGIRPPIPEVVWTSVATGKLAAVHGVESFSATSADLRSRRLWDILQERGWSVGLFGWPVTWPPPAVEGFVVPAVSDNGTETYPRDLNFIRELAESEKTRRPRTWGRYCRYAFLGIRWGARLSTLIEAGRELLADPLRGRSLDTAQLFTRRKLQAKLHSDYFIELRRKQPVDFAAFYTNVVHVAQSYFWKYHEPGAFHGVSPEDIARYGESVHDAYRIVDDFLGRILADTGPNDLVLVVSDHGAEALADTTPTRLTLRLDAMLRAMRLAGALEATNLGARTYLRPQRGQEKTRDGVRRMLASARLSEADIHPFDARVDDWGNVVVTVDPAVESHLDDTLLFQGGRARMGDIVRATELQESAQMKDTGALVVAGKGVARGGRVEGASLFDLVPTLLVLSGLDLAADLPGNVMVGALDAATARRIPGMVASYEPATDATPRPE